MTGFGSDRLSELQGIDFGGTGDNILILDASIVRAAAGATNSLTGAGESLLIDGDAGDVLNTGAGRANTGSVTIGGNGYSIF